MKSPNLLGALEFFASQVGFKRPELEESLEVSIDFGYVMNTHLKRVDNTDEVVQVIEDAISDGEITLSDWMKIGNRLGLKRK